MLFAAGVFLCQMLESISRTLERNGMLGGEGEGVGGGVCPALCVCGGGCMFSLFFFFFLHVAPDISEPVELQEKQISPKSIFGSLSHPRKI